MIVHAGHSFKMACFLYFSPFYRHRHFIDLLLAEKSPYVLKTRLKIYFSNLPDCFILLGINQSFVIYNSSKPIKVWKYFF